MNSVLVDEATYGCYFVHLRDSYDRVIYSVQIIFYPEDHGYTRAFWRMRETYTLESQFDVG